MTACSDSNPHLGKPHLGSCTEASLQILAHATVHLEQHVHEIAYAIRGMQLPPRNRASSETKAIILMPHKHLRQYNSP